jgi:hypothetical protein
MTTRVMESGSRYLILMSCIRFLDKILVYVLDEALISSYEQKASCRACCGTYHDHLVRILEYGRGLKTEGE